VWVATDDRFPGSTGGACLILKQFGVDAALAQPFPRLMIFSKDKRFEVRGDYLAERTIRSVKSAKDGGVQITKSFATRRRIFSKRQGFELKVVDPPYNLQIGGYAVSAGSHREFAMASGEMSETEFRSFLSDTLGAAARVSRDGAIHFVCMDWRHMDDVSAVGLTVYGERLNLCIWNKSNAGMGSLYRSKHELVFVYRVGTALHLNMVELGRHGRNRSNVWDYASVNSLRGNRREDLALHPTVKPTGLVADAIMDVTRRGDFVLDLFLGSGTTLLAADRTGRRFRGLDIDPAYVDVAIDRWSARSGLEPRLEGSVS
jgi:DNA modification methylase